jgi:hypothetical protein
MRYAKPKCVVMIAGSRDSQMMIKNGAMRKDTCYCSFNLLQSQENTLTFLVEFLVQKVIPKGKHIIFPLVYKGSVCGVVGFFISMKYKFQLQYVLVRNVQHNNLYLVENGVPVMCQPFFEVVYCLGINC